MSNQSVKFIDLFSGMGGIRLGFEQAFQKAGIKTECVFTSEIKEAAVKVHKANFPDEVFGDITQIKTEVIPDFDFLLGGFPCQAFSVAGKQRGFADTRGTLFFEVERILREKKPFGFLLENVRGLVTHDRENTSDPTGRTLDTIITSLTNLGYKVSYKVLDSKDFGVPQSRGRIYIVGTKTDQISLTNFKEIHENFGSVMEHNLPVIKSDFTEKLFQAYEKEDLYGKSIKDKRGGENNIHSWDLSLRGPVSEEQKSLLNALLKERRKRHWAEKIGIHWMDGMPLTTNQIKTFFDNPNLQKLLDDLTKKGYLVLEHPKKKVGTNTSTSDQIYYERIPDSDLPKGYNIVTGKLSFQFSRILCPNSIAPTLVAMDMDTIGVLDEDGLRNLTLTEGLRLFGYPKNYSLADFEKTQKGIRQGFDLLGNSVCVPVIEAICSRIAIKHTKLQQYRSEKDKKEI